MAKLNPALGGPQPTGAGSVTRAGADLRVRGMAEIAVMAAVIAALTLVPGIYLFGGAVPITLQSLGVIMAATLLGARKGAAAVIVYLALILVGLPVATGFMGGLAPFAGPSGGFLVGFIPMALVMGALASIAVRRWRGVKLTLGLFVAGLAGIPVLYCFGAAWLAQVTGMPLSAAAKTMLVFVIGDVLKAAAGAVTIAGVIRALPGRF